MQFTIPSIVAFQILCSVKTITAAPAPGPPDFNSGLGTLTNVFNRGTSAVMQGVGTVTETGNIITHGLASLLGIAAEGTPMQRPRPSHQPPSAHRPPPYGNMPMPLDDYRPSEEYHPPYRPTAFEEMESGGYKPSTYRPSSRPPSPTEFDSEMPLPSGGTHSGKDKRPYNPEGDRRPYHPEGDRRPYPILPLPPHGMESNGDRFTQRPFSSGGMTSVGQELQSDGPLWPLPPSLLGNVIDPRKSRYR